MVSGVWLRDDSAGIISDHYGVEIAKPSGRRLSVGQAGAGGLDEHHRRGGAFVSSQQNQIHISERGFKTGTVLYRPPKTFLRAGLKIARGAAVKDFGCGQGGEGASARSPASPQRAVLAEPTPPTDNRLTATGVFALQAIWLRCSSVEDP